MRQRWIQMLGVAVLGLAVAGAAGCGRSDRGWHHDDADAVAWHVHRALDHMDATDEQRLTLEPLAREMAAEMLAMRPGAERLRDLAMTEWNAATPDVAALHKQLDAELDLVRATLHRLVDQGVVLHGVLTPEQREDVSRAAAWHRRWHR